MLGRDSFGRWPHARNESIEIGVVQSRSWGTPRSPPERYTAVDNSEMRAAMVAALDG